MSIRRLSSLTEVAWAVCTALDHVGVEAVLTGGSAATFYAPDAYESRDLDYILLTGDPSGAAEEALLALGYHRDGDHYTHRENPFILEFPRGPLAVGGEILDRFSTNRENGQILRVLTPTDCCKDRLSAFYHWSDRGALQQAVAVAASRADEIDLAELRGWSEREGHSERYREFARDVWQTRPPGAQGK